MSEQAYWFKEYTQGRRYFLKIVPGQSLVDCLQRFVKEKEIHSAVILSAVGSVRDVRLRDIKSGAKLPITPARLTEHVLEGPLELLGLSGNIVPGETQGDEDCHLHIIAAKASGDVVGGHMYDAEVFATCEIVLVELVVGGVERHLSKTGGTPTVFFAQE
jgi:predicted DNA-binding protein with PD1-like motif